MRAPPEGPRAEKRAAKLIVYENVTGLLASSGGKDFDAVCDAFIEMGYRFGAMMIDAARFVPQSRERVFIVAIDDGPRRFPSSSSPIDPARPSIRLVWSRLAPSKVGVDLVESSGSAGAQYGPRRSHRGRAHGRPLAHQGRDRSADRDDVLGQSRQARRSQARRQADGRRSLPALRPGADGVKVQRAEIRFDHVAGCLRIPTGGSSRQTIVIVEGTSVRSRLLSPREAARLMGLPDSYKLPSNYNDAYGLMGDGVAAPVVRHLAANLLEPILRTAETCPSPDIPAGGRTRWRTP